MRDEQAASDQQRELAADVLNTWQYVTTALFALAKPETVERWFEQAREVSATWSLEQRLKAIAEINSGEFVTRVFNPEFVAEYRKALAEAQLGRGETLANSDEN